MSDRKVSRVLFLTFCCIIFIACGTSRRKQGLEELKALGLYSGVVTHHAGADALVIVVLLHAETNTMGTYSVTDPQGRFECLFDRGDYRLLAFVDENGDFQWNNGEPWALGTDPVIETNRGEEPTNRLEIPATTNGTPPVSIDLSAQALPTSHEIHRAALGRVVAQDDPMLGPEVGTLSLWQPVEFLKAKYAGILLLDEFDPEKMPVVFVNGIGGSPSEMMTIANRLDRSRFQPVFIGYPSGLPIELNGWWLYQLSIEIRARIGSAGGTIFIAHSMGGLVARSMINRMVAAGGPHPRAFISISTPWGGHASASERGSRIIAVPVWADLVPGSVFLQDLCEQPLPDDLHYYLLFSYGGASAMVSGSDDGTVTISSMLYYPVQDQSRWTYGFDESHDSIVRSEKVITSILRILDEEFARERGEN